MADEFAINEAQDSPGNSGEKGRMNWTLPTLGGMQFWTDHRWLGGWRIQQNVLTGHFRLLDPYNIRHAWGSQAACEAELNRRLPSIPIPKQANHAVVLLHGLMRTSRCMQAIAEDVNTAELGMPVRFEYASTRAPIAEHAAALREVIEKLPGEPDISFVGHSMGNIVVRHAIGDWQKHDPHRVLPRLRRVVMLGPPNQGATIARRLSALGLFGMITGKGGLELGPAWEDLQSHLAIPPCPCAVIAGDVSNAAIKNPLLEGPGDFVVSVEEAKLEGASLLIIPSLHSFLMDDQRARSATLRFLQGGSLEESAQTAPPS